MLANVSAPKPTLCTLAPGRIDPISPLQQHEDAARSTPLSLQSSIPDLRARVAATSLVLGAEPRAGAIVTSAMLSTVCIPSSARQSLSPLLAVADLHARYTPLRLVY
jgi:hypothetical protein